MGSNSIELAGRDVVLMLDWPGPTLLDGNGTTRVYIDDAADTNQQKELEDIFQEGEEALCRCYHNL